MMRKKIVSLCMALVLCLTLLPATALAEGAAPDNNLYVGDQVLPVGRDSYWTTSTDGELITCEATNDWNVAYDARSTTLTLKNATIEGVLNDVNTAGTGIYAASSSGAVSLNIFLEGENRVSGGHGINVSSGKAASLSISGSGSLTVSATAMNGVGILVQAQYDANLTINGANVNAVVTETNGRGVELSTGQVGNPNLTIEVKGGSLQASGQPNGIKFFTSANDTRANANLKVSGNAMVKTSGITTDADGSGSQGAVLTTEAGTGETGGIVFDGKNGTVYGDVTLQEDITIGEGESLTLDDGASLNTGDYTLTVDGGTLTGNVTGKVTYKVTGVSLSNDSLTLDVGGTKELIATITPETATDKNLTWASDAEGVATVDQNGEVNAVAPGTANITVTTQDGSHTATCAVTVTQPVTGVTLDPTSLSLFTGDTATLTATVEPENATNKNVTWSSDDTSVATVDATGKVTAVSAGTATITVTTVDQSKTATCEVTVAAATVPVTGVTLSQNEAHLYYNRTPNTLTLTATVAPDNATNKAVTWTSSNPSVATVENGVVTAAARGTAVITATAADGSGASASCTVTVSSYLPPANPNYRITVEATQGGTVTADPTAAKAGTTVTLTPVPHRGYQVGTVAVTDRFGEAVAVTEQADGTYTFTMPNGQVTVTVTFEQAPLPFHDVAEGDWFYDAVRYAYETGLMDGVGDNLFAPNSETTRAQLVTILYRLEGEPEPGGDSGFSDVAAGTWYTDAVAWAAENGIVNGTTDTTFAPGDDITREQLVTVLYRYAESKGYDVSASADLSGYPDAGQVQDYAQPAMAWAVAEGIVEGVDGPLNPAGNATRAQIATILMRFCEGVAK